MQRWNSSRPGPSGSDDSWLRRAAVVVTLTLLAPPAGAASQARDPELKARLMEAVSESNSFPDRFEAQVWLTDMAGRLGTQVPDPGERVEILRRVHYEAKRVEIEPELVLAVIDVESAFDRFAISVAGARGLMQVMPFWLDELDRPDDNLFDIQTNLRMGCTILRYYMDMEPDSLTRALLRYNGSLGGNGKYSQKVLGKLDKRWFPQ